MLTFAAPAFLWTLLALPLVVLLHRIRARRQRREVAGLFLWRRAKDLGTSRPRFHAGLLLLLQLLAVTGLALALARPQLVLAGPVDRVIVIDASASMLASDAPAIAGTLGDAAGGAAGEPSERTGPSGRTRLGEARRAAARLAQEAGRVAIVRAGREPRTVLGYTTDALEVQQALDGLVAGDAGMDADRALLLARDLASQGGGASDASLGDASGEEGSGEDAPAADGGPRAGSEIHWLSDTPPPSLAGVRIHALAGSGSNVGITGFEVVAGQAWVRLSSNGPRPVEVPVQLLRGDAPVARSDLLVPARGDVSFTMPVGDGGGTVTARITPPEGDALAVDDAAFAGSPATVVGLERGFAAMERALGAIPEVRTRVGASVRDLPLDLYVLTGSAAEDPPDGPVVLLPPRDAPAIAAEVLDWARTEPLLRFVDLRTLVVALSDPPPFGEEEGWTTLIRGVPRAGEAGEQGEEVSPPEPVPLLQRRGRPSGPIWRFAFHPVRGDLTLRPAFPTLVVNLVDLVRGVSRVRLGEVLPEGATRDGEAVRVALEPGFYDLNGRSLHASLLSEEETRLPGPAAFAALGGAGADADAAAGPDGAADRAAVQGPAPAAEDATLAPRTLVPWLLVLVLIVVLLEWWGWSGWRSWGWR